jgi:hypothetical protein
VEQARHEWGERRRSIGAYIFNYSNTHVALVLRAADSEATER